MRYKLILIGMAFLAGLAVNNIATAANVEQPLGNSTGISMPKNRISEDQIIVRNDRVVLDINNPQWSRFTPTKSMVPFIDKGANAIQVRPKAGCGNIKVGDVISYDSSFTDTTVIHRVVERGIDKKGLYFLAKGDNNEEVDPERIRCDQIKRVLVAVVY